MAKRVLLIEDEPSIIEAIRFILARDGWAVDTHADGASALDALARRRPDVVILDAMLPGRSGFDILADLRADPATAALPVLMLTARGQAKDRDRALRLGASRFMTKPFSNAEVLEVVNALHATPAGGPGPEGGAAATGRDAGASDDGEADPRETRRPRDASAAREVPGTAEARHT